MEPVQSLDKIGRKQENIGHERVVEIDCVLKKKKEELMRDTFKIFIVWILLVAFKYCALNYWFN